MAEQLVITTCVEEFNSSVLKMWWRFGQNYKAISIYFDISLKICIAAV